VAYNAVKFVHILLAIVAVGFNASYAIWLRRAATEPEHELHVLRGIKILDDRFANPAYVLLLLSGLFMVWLAGIPITRFWIAAAIVLWVIASAAGGRLFAAFRSAPGDGGGLAAIARANRSVVVWLLLAGATFLLLIDMIFKPGT
jgi:uncharacterized membrane protein